MIVCFILLIYLDAINYPKLVGIVTKTIADLPKIKKIEKILSSVWSSKRINVLWGPKWEYPNGRKTQTTLNLVIKSHIILNLSSS